MLQLVRRLLGRQRSTLPPFDFARNRYKAKKEWPPWIRELNERQQFRFERKFKRRLLIKSIKPTYIKWNKIVMWSLISFVTVYAVLWHDFANDPMNPRPEEQPFNALRNWVKSWTDSIWTHTSTVGPDPDPEAIPQTEERKLTGPEAAAAAAMAGKFQTNSSYSFDPIKYQKQLRDEQAAIMRAQEHYQKEVHDEQAAIRRAQGHYR
ncbi:hypothetical protein K504DRAFT_464060 [Pleomassaria siparia CBS 279.74]|uniref:Uncharacterized protein n=1 Tax=Pleomassaria siparia CBS 279.74 TaxID=1314801 RepID=A0A6G1KHK6_9PLEO|nr:hypothetical protein K504DRAFT_464060 [Pleomassaria siparia CBS 279.74]